MTPTFTFEVALGEPDVPNYAPSPTIGRAAPTKGVRSSAPAAAGVAAGAAARNRPHRAEATGAARAPAYSAVTGAPRSRWPRPRRGCPRDHRIPVPRALRSQSVLDIDYRLGCRWGLPLVRSSVDMAVCVDVLLHVEDIGVLRETAW